MVTDSQLSAQSSMEKRCFTQLVTFIREYENLTTMEKEDAFRTCKTKLIQQVNHILIKFYFQVRKFCDFTAVKKPGKLLYCYDRGFTLNVILYVITCIRINKCTLTKECNPVQRKKFPGLVSCCLDQLECVRDWAEMQKHTLGVARLGNTRITV